MTLAQKLKLQRSILGMSQMDLARESGISHRAITAYECGERTPIQKNLIQLAQTLHVSLKYLSDDDCEDPEEGIDRDIYIRQAQDLYGTSGAREVERLLEANMALFAGGSLTMEQKEEFFEAVTQAYLDCRAEARRRFGRKKKPEDENDG